MVLMYAAINYVAYVFSIIDMNLFNSCLGYNIPTELNSDILLYIDSFMIDW
jgi:hypothetical protein